MRTFIFLLPLLLSLPTTAQPNLLNDPDISWIGAFTTDYRFDATIPMKPHHYSYDWNTVGVEKLLMLPRPSGFPVTTDATELFWKIRLMELLDVRELEAFDDPQLETVLSEEDRLDRMSSLDTFYQTNEATQQTRMYLVRNEKNMEDFHGVRVYQWAYLRKSDRSIGYRAVSWAPLYGQVKEGTDRVAYEPVAWLPAFPAEDPDALRRSDDVSYVFVTTSRDQSPKLEEMKSLKGTMDWQSLISDFIRDPWATAYDTEGDFQELSARDIQEFSAGIDTIVTFDPLTYAENMQIVRHPDLSVEVGSIRFVVRWFYDERLRRLYYEPVGLSPMARVYDEEGNLRYYRPAFYWGMGR
jgi:hypothetical protein